jgi:hypothetical protein
VANFEIPPAPKGLKTSGRKLWQAVNEGNILNQAELTVLKEMCRVSDRLDLLAETIDKYGGVVGAQVHAAMVEARQLELVLAKLHAVLRFPDPATGTKPQYRGMRGPQGLVR